VHQRYGGTYYRDDRGDPCGQPDLPVIVHAAADLVAEALLDR